MRKLSFLLGSFLFSIVMLAQDGTKDVNVNFNTKGGAWYASPWVWVVGAAIFILLLVAISRGSGRRAD